MSMKERNERFTIKMLNKVFIEGDEQFEKELKKEILIHDVKEHRKEVLGRLKNTEKQYKDLKKQYKGDEIDFEEKKACYEKRIQYYNRLADKLFEIIFKLENGKDAEDIREDFDEAYRIQKGM